MSDGRVILGIETSCDETAVAVVAADGPHAGLLALSSEIASQNDLHAEFRGVVPEIASRAHAERVLPVFRRALTAAGVGLSDIAGVAIGHRPGLIGSLLVGVSAGKALAWSLGVPLVGVDHVQAHLYAGLMWRRGEPPVPSAELFPALGLVASGGHTSIYRCESPTRLTRLGGTIDDAVGEAYDKVGAILGLPFPGGPAVDAMARQGNDRAFAFPVSRLGRASLDFSFSGLKTAVRYAVEGVPGSEAAAPVRSAKFDADICASFQRAASRAVVMKLSSALDGEPDGFRDYRSLLIGGGVSANSRLRADLAELATVRGLAIRIPAMALCVDNAAMIAGLGYRVLADRQWASDALTLTAAASSA